MYDDIFSVFNVIALGLIAGGGAGLLIGFLAGTQVSEWGTMTRRNKIITFLLIVSCSAIAIAALSWGFLLQ